MVATAEHQRLLDARRGAGWRRWGPYLSERQWGTVREDYSENGDAWAYFPHDQARSRAYRWGEDGLAGISDEQQRLCFSLAMWNEHDPILKERLFGLTNAEGNHGEDVKEYYFYVDNTPTHSYQRWLYKYPQREFPYADLVRTNGARTRQEPEYELLDTGVFAEQRYFDVEVEYAKAGPEDLLCRITVHNRGPEDAPIHLLPTLWFRNTWAVPPHTARPRLALVPSHRLIVEAEHDELGSMFLYGEADNTPLFCENETNGAHLWGTQNTAPFVKDGINDHVVNGAADAVNPAAEGTKLAVHVHRTVPAGESVTYRVRLCDSGPSMMRDAFVGFDELIERRRTEADEFYRSITPPAVEPEAARVMRQALAGMLWSKQFYNYDLDVWLREHQSHPYRRPKTRTSRNEAWSHMLNHDIISMPDKWEYPWYAAWDLAFHTMALMLVDPDFAKHQIELMLTPNYLHPTGQMPAYEWNFGDVNPPVHAFATLFMHTLDEAAADRRLGGKGAGERNLVDLTFLKSTFNQLILNYSWWVNRKDLEGRSLFEGGFLGLDNIGVFDRSAALPTGGRLEQADGTAWMALFSQNMLELALVLAEHDPSYEDFVLRFLGRFFRIAAAIDPVGNQPDDMWDDEDGFFYDVLRLPDGTGVRLKVRSLVGLLPLCATTVFEPEVLEKFPRLRELVRQGLERNADLLSNIPDPRTPGVNGRLILSLVNEDKLRRILCRMLDEQRFLGPHGIRSLSRHHLDEPYTFTVNGHDHTVSYEAAESTTAMFGGNSNWRGPVWVPMNVLIIRSLLQHYLYYGDAFTVECPTGSGTFLTLFDVAKEISDRLVSTFLPDADGRRPVFGDVEEFQSDEHWRDQLLFFEYFNGDDGAGLGASHQTGWTGLIARLIQTFGHLDPELVLRDGGRVMARPYHPVVPPPPFGESIVHSDLENLPPEPVYVWDDEAPKRWGRRRRRPD